MDDAAGMTTARLMLRRFAADDLDWLDRFMGDPRTTRFLGGPKPRAETEKMLHERILAYYDRHPGLGVWVTLERATGECAGYHLLNHIHGEQHIQVGYGLFPQFWGRGYATEMTVALLRYGFTRRGLAQITAIVDQPNLASQRVVLRAGLRRNGERSFEHPAYKFAGALAWFERDAAGWLEEFGSST